MKKLTSLLPAAGICLLLGVLFLTTSLKRTDYRTDQNNQITCRLVTLGDMAVPPGTDTIVMDVYPTMKSSSDSIKLTVLFRDANGKVIGKKPSTKAFKQGAFNYVNYVVKIGKKVNSIPLGYIEGISQVHFKPPKCIYLCFNEETEEMTYEVVDCTSRAMMSRDSIGKCPPCNARFALEYQSVMKSIMEKVAANTQVKDR